MAAYIQIEEFLQKSETLKIIDVRSPSEFEQGHITGAVNIPMFSDDERASVGTKYKHEGKEAAVLLGLDIIGTKMSKLARLAKKYAANKELLVHCWRGGMRSASMAWLFETIGLKCYLLEGGYKNYRAFIRKSFEIPASFYVIGGYTGTGKTEIIEILESEKFQVINLEEIAHHKGSAFGSLGMEPQPTNEQFENNLYSFWQKIDFTKPVFLEDESEKIGTVRIPEPFFKQLKSAVLLFFNMSNELRAKRLVNDYAVYGKTLLADSVNKIADKFGGIHAKNCLAELENNNFEKVALMLLLYYDKAYGHALKKFDRKVVYNLELTNISHADNKDKIIGFINEIVKS